MAGICFYAPNSIPLPALPRRKNFGFCCCTASPNNQRVRSQTPQILKFAVTAATEFLRLFSFPSQKLDATPCEQEDELSVSGVDDVVIILKSDYENAYFVTGKFTSEIYDENCAFEDPTIKFYGKELYSRNLKLLVPFFDNPSIKLQKIEKNSNPQNAFITASWSLRTYLKLPWKPLISIDGSTIYEMDSAFKIIRHAESWSVTALEAISQVFWPGFVRPED